MNSWNVFLGTNQIQNAMRRERGFFSSAMPVVATWLLDLRVDAQHRVKGTYGLLPGSDTLDGL